MVRIMGIESKLTSKCQTTIPKEVRQLLKVGPGDRIGYEIIDGRVMMVPRNLRAADITGILHRPGQKAVTVEEMNDAVGKAIVERYERSIDRR